MTTKVVKLPSGGPPELRGRPLYHLAEAVGQGKALTTILGKNRASAPETAFSTVPKIIEKFSQPGDEEL